MEHEIETWESKRGGAAPRIVIGLVVLSLMVLVAVAFLSPGPNEETETVEQGAAGEETDEPAGDTSRDPEPTAPSANKGTTATQGQPAQPSSFTQGGNRYVRGIVFDVDLSPTTVDKDAVLTVFTEEGERVRVYIPTRKTPCEADNRALASAREGAVVEAFGSIEAGGVRSCIASTHYFRILEPPQELIVPAGHDATRLDIKFAPRFDVGTLGEARERIPSDLMDLLSGIEALDRRANVEELEELRGPLDYWYRVTVKQTASIPIIRQSLLNVPHIERVEYVPL